MSVDTSVTISRFRVNDDAVCAHFARLEKRLLGQEGIGLQMLVRLREVHNEYCRQLIRYADLTLVDAFCLPFEGRVAEVVGELQAGHERFLDQLEQSIEPALTNESLRQQESAWRVEFASWPATRALEYIEKHLNQRLGLNADKSVITSPVELAPKLQILASLHRAEIVELLRARQGAAKYEY